jgi:excisionase family DNA binding protein
LKHLTHLAQPKRPSTLRAVKHLVEEATTEMSGSQYLTRSEVSKLLGVSPNTVTRWAREGRLACLVTLGGHHRFDRDVVEQLRKQQYRESHDRDEDRTA